MRSMFHFNLKPQTLTQTNKKTQERIMRIFCATIFTFSNIAKCKCKCKCCQRKLSTAYEAKTQRHPRKKSEESIFSNFCEFY